MTTLWIGDLCQTWGEAQLNALFADARIYFRSNFLLAGFLHSKLIVNRETGCSAGMAKNIIYFYRVRLSRIFFT